MNKKLTQPQRLALGALHNGEWRSAYDLQIHRRVLDSLVRKNLLERRGVGRLGSMWSPRTTIEYRLIPPQVYSAEKFAREIIKIEQCEECHCSVGADWQYIPYSAKSIVMCPQCRTEYKKND